MYILTQQCSIACPGQHLLVEAINTFALASSLTVNTKACAAMYCVSKLRLCDYATAKYNLGYRHG